MTYTVNNKFGIGTVTEIDEKYSKVVFESGDERKMLNQFIIKFDTYEEAFNKLNEVEEVEEVKYDAKLQSDIEEMNRKGAMNQRPSSMR